MCFTLVEMLCHFLMGLLPGSLTYLWPCQQHTFTQDFIHSGLLPLPLPVTVRALLYRVAYLSCIFKVHNYTGRILYNQNFILITALGSDGNEEVGYSTGCKPLKIVCKEYILSLAPSCILCFLTSMLASLLSCPVTEGVLSALPSQIQNNEARQPWTEVSETIAKRKCSLFTLFLRFVVTGRADWDDSTQLNVFQIILSHTAGSKYSFTFAI